MNDLEHFIAALKHNAAKTHDDTFGYGVSVAIANFEKVSGVYEAAPDMLAALQAAVSPTCIGSTGLAQQFFRDNEASRAAIKTIKSAIAKATGA